MTIDKSRNDEQNLSPRSVKARFFHFYDHTKNSQIPSILKRRGEMRFTNARPLRDSTPAVNRNDDSPRIKLDRRTSSSESSTLCQSPERILKIIMPNDLDGGDTAVPSSFSPPSSKFPIRRTTSEYRELSCNSNNVRFHSKVLVMRIPSRNQYPESMKRNLWSSLSEIARSAQRNTIEFSSEGWNWRSAVEEDHMYVHPKTGQYIHPVHVQRAASSTTSTSDADKRKASKSVGTKAEMNDKHKADSPDSTAAQPAHE
mmetsp:Transcript_3162/g.7214  ORF Transcript_3162/g.7214 Transcript_3162/m.7214 type:complete len:257 (-) Transcript_3162:336-1106(-)|eukprot:CAMPEP_0201129458 /NCGR_PEP_ID=MMETSP0850-20130426/37017_1 /ASSEMBLY_ACC=CAM_ASM_000622 /TAXON_ID=183588 /ORGANISM="Pseudo-nitzschia fraudulenta, Strain WWA7" /LENGTH=256 /DNA_ID=CAMNT_0047398935 /DNA_START=110 /DNA_END=880 /DNA_ORIENTATION=-